MCPVLLAPALFCVRYCGTEGMHAEVLFLRQTAQFYVQLATYCCCVYVEVTRLLLLFTGFFLFLYLPLFFSFLRLVSATLRQDVTLMYDSLCLSRSCLASFRCPAVSVCVCASRSFSALFLRVPHRGCTGVLICQTAPMVQLLCSMWKFAAIFCL